MPSLHWTSTRLPNQGGRVAAIANNADARWTGSVQVRVGDCGGSHSHTCGSVECEDVWSGRSVACHVAAAPDHGGFAAATLTLSIESHDLAVVKASCVRAHARRDVKRNT